jgi:hypothetical protein
MTVIFFHIEKTGGMTLKDILARQYTNIFDIRQSKDFDARREDLKAMPQSERDKIELVQGHQQFGLHELFSDAYYVTILRHPIERVISTYRYYRRTKDAPLHKTAMNVTLREFVEEKIKPHNEMVRVLGDGDYEIAKRNLEWFCYGTLERYDETIVYFKKIFDWKKVFYTKANRAKEPLQVPTETRNLIAKHNFLDMFLYFWASERFDRLLKISMPEIDKKVRLFRLLNKTIGRFYIGERTRRYLKRKMA